MIRNLAIIGAVATLVLGVLWLKAEQAPESTRTGVQAPSGVSELDLLIGVALYLVWIA